MRAFVDLKLDGSYHMSDKTARQYEVERVIEPDRRVNNIRLEFFSGKCNRATGLSLDNTRRPPDRRGRKLGIKFDD